MKRRLTESQRKGLQNLVDGLCLGHHCRGQSQHGGFTATVTVLLNAGLVDYPGCNPASAYRITTVGRKALVDGYYIKGDGK